LPKICFMEVRLVPESSERTNKEVEKQISEELSKTIIP